LHLDRLVVETVYSVCALAYVLLSVLMALRGRMSKTGLAILGCCVASTVWATATATGAPFGALALLDSLRLSAWLLLVLTLVTIRKGGGSGLGRTYLFGGLAYCFVAIAYDGWALAANSNAAGLQTPQVLIRICFAVAGLLTIENLWRNTRTERHWHVWPLCLAIGGVFAYELFLFSDAFITRGRADPGLGLATVLSSGSFRRKLNPRYRVTFLRIATTIASSG
jgi:hypothetical protein